MLETRKVFSDSAFEARYIKLADIIHDWVKQNLDFEKSDVLDFGCGEGITALGIADRFAAKSVFGVDIMPDPQRCLSVAGRELGIASLPSNLKLRQISPSEEFAPHGSFDLIYSWSVFEHVQQPILDSLLKQLHNLLRPDGYLFIQIAPLYYSSEGSHLFHKISEPWGHLVNQDSVYFDKLCKSCDSQVEIDALWSCYQWLNKLTGPELVSKLTSTGFEIVRQYVTQDEHLAKIPPQLLSVFNNDVLGTNQIVLLCRKK
jgi:SAM-dependent methyltransferase